MDRLRCLRCKQKLPAPSVNHLCDDCTEVVPRRDGLTDLTSIRRKIIKPKVFIDENGKEVTDELPMRPLWTKPEPNELWAQRGMDTSSKKRNNV
jgi:hypothetical protein